MSKGILYVMALKSTHCYHILHVLLSAGIVFSDLQRVQGGLREEEAKGPNLEVSQEYHISGK